MYNVLDLSSYHNHKMFVKDNGLVTREVGINGDFFIDTNNFVNKELLINGVKFNTINNGEYDNIVCDGQNIILTPTNILNLHILGFCEIENVFDEIIITTLNGKSYNLKVFFKIWSIINFYEYKYDIAHPNVLVAYSGKDNLYRNEYIYHYKYKVDIPDKICSIELPCNPVLHIFAISLGR